MLDHLVTVVTDLAAHHAPAAYALTGVAALAEALPVVGTLFPGSILIVAIAALAGSGSLSAEPLILAAILGAIVGDGVSFWLGQRYGTTLATRWPLSRYPHWLDQAEGLFRRHGGKGVFLARFVQGPRAFVPLVAGMSDMPALRFYAVNVASAIVWGVSHVLGGVLLGASLHIVAQVAGRLLLLLVVFALLVWGVVWLTRRILLTRGLEALGRAQARLTRWSAPGDTPARRLTAKLLRTARGEGLILAGAVALLIGCLWLFVGILEDLLTGDPLVQANQAVFHALQALRTSWSDTLMLAITELGDGFITTSLTVAIAAWLLVRRAWRPAAYWLVALGGAALFTPLIKAAVHWPRPTADLYNGWEAFSFPSGHATINAVLYGFLGFLIARELPARHRGWPIGTACLIVTMIAFSRLYLGAHWLADVVAGIAIGTAWVVLLAIALGRRHKGRIGAGGLLATALLTLALVWPYHLHRQLNADSQRYVPQPDVQQLAWSAWREDGYRRLPAHRIDLGGEEEEPLTLQWAGDLTALRQALASHGWRVDTPWSLGNALDWLSPGDTTPADALPVLPRLDDGRPPRLRASHALAPDRRAVLQIWPSTYTITLADGADSLPLWLGSVVVQRRQTILGTLALERRLDDIGPAWQLLRESLPGSFTGTRQPAGNGGWDGRLLLAAPPTASSTSNRASSSPDRSGGARDTRPSDAEAAP